MKYNIPADATEVPSHTEHGGYPLFYVTKESDVICPSCVNASLSVYRDKDDPNYIEVVDVNWEDGNLYCDDCGNHVVSAYAEEEKP